MKKLILASILLLGAQSFADGFICQNLDQNLRIKVFHQTQPVMGTRNAAIMIVSDPSISDGHKTTATFSADNALLTSNSSTYTADVDLRFGTSDLKGRNIGGTKLGNLDQIILSVGFSYSDPVPAGTPISAEAVLIRRNGGDDIRIPMDCTRYLKN